MSSRRAKQIGWNSLGVAVFALMAFPVFWMISTAFKPTDEINSVTPTWFSAHPTLQHFRDALARPYFWTDVKNSVIVVLATVVIAVALSFVAITLYAALSQVPHELLEAASIDGAPAWRAFKDVTVPVIKPALLILTSLSILWDFGVFTQPFLLIGQGHIIPANYLMGIYLYEEGYVKTEFGRGAAISILMLVIVAAMSVVYVRRMLKIGAET